MTNHRATGRAHVRPLARTPQGLHRSATALPAGMLKIGVLGALATATIAVPVASATASQTGQATELPGALAGAQAAPAAPAAPVAAPVAAPQALPGVTAAVHSSPQGALTARPAPATTTTVEDAAQGDQDAVPATGKSGYIDPVNAPITSGYGWRTHPVLGYRKMHDGVDFGAACGAPVRAVQSGTVTKAERAGSSGNRLEIDHGNGVITGYFHLEGFDAHVGETVSQGEVVGRVGSTGRSTGCHLHFAKIDSAGEYSNPMTILR